MFLALALAATIHVAPGDTLSGIAASQGVSLSALEAANPQFSNPNLIFVGQEVNVPGGQGIVHSNSISGDTADSGSPASSLAPVYHSSSQGSSSQGSSSQGSSSSSGSSGVGTSSGSSGGYSSSDLASIPGVPRSFAACVAFRESGNGTNQAYNGGVYGIINASGYHVNGQSLAAQKQAFASLYRQYGTAPWAPSDGCHV